MGYSLGVDLGTTYCAAAVLRDGQTAPEVVTLGASSAVMPTVVLLRADGEVLEGESAVRRGVDEPTRVAREFKRRLGDPTPLVLGGTPYGADALMGHVLREIIRITVEREGAAPDRLVLTHPANYGPYKLEQVREVARLAGADLDRLVLVTEPEAAAISYATRERIAPGEVVAVYDFGGGTFDVALLRRTEHGFVGVGRPDGMERFGGIDIDAAILAFVDTQLGGALTALDPTDPEVQVAVARLKEDCRVAKETLSSDTDASIPVSLPGLQTRVRLTRAELEEIVRPRIVETIDALGRAVASASLGMDDVGRILLVGGSSRTPLVGEMIAARTGRPVAVDAHPKFTICLGAAVRGTVPASAAADAAAAALLASLAAPPIATAAPVAGGAPPPLGSAAPPPPPPPPAAARADVPFVASAVPPPTKARRGLLIGAVAAIVALGGVGVVLATRSGSTASSATTTLVAGDGATGRSATTTSASEATTTAAVSTAAETTGVATTVAPTAPPTTLPATTVAPATAPPETVAPVTVPPETAPPATAPPETPPPATAPPVVATAAPSTTCPVRKHNAAVTADCGDTGALVVMVQQLLNCVGFPVNVDGRYGQNTFLAVMAFQQANPGLSVDGGAGPATQTALQAACPSG
jgi:actin-like ATPase involved in cell morphogenesis